MQTLNSTLQNLMAGYCFSTLVLLVLAVFLVRVKSFLVEYLDVANLIILIVLSILLLFRIQEFLVCRGGDGSGGPSRDVDGVKGLDGLYCLTMLIWELLLGFVFQFFFVFRRFRVRIWMSLISALLVLGLVYLELWNVMFSELFRDYLPSSWSVIYPLAGWWRMVLYSLVYFGGCWALVLLKRRRK